MRGCRVCRDVGIVPRVEGWATRPRHLRRFRLVILGGIARGWGGVRVEMKRCGDARDERVPLRAQRIVARGAPGVARLPQPRRTRRAFAVEPHERRLDGALVAGGCERVRDAPGAHAGVRGGYAVILGRRRDVRGPRGCGPDPLGHDGVVGVPTDDLNLAHLFAPFRPSAALLRSALGRRVTRGRTRHTTDATVRVR